MSGGLKKSRPHNPERTVPKPSRREVVMENNYHGIYIREFSAAATHLYEKKVVLLNQALIDIGTPSSEKSVPSSATELAAFNLLIVIFL